MQLKSPAFHHDATIPTRHTCEGEDVSPPLTWTDVPAEAQALVLIVDDPDAPDPAAPRMTWVHWVVVNLPPRTSGLPEGGALPEGAQLGLNDWKKAAWGGPCPPIGEHRYVFKLHALDAPLAGLTRPTRADVERAMAGHVLALAQLVGRYRKQRG